MEINGKVVERFSVGHMTFTKFIDNHGKEKFHISNGIHGYHYTKYQAIEIAGRILELFEVGKKADEKTS